jgi:hypothetical protein
MNRKSLHVLIAGAGLAVAVAAAINCGSSGTVVATTYAYDDPDLYMAYYPADVVYASYYWAYPWDYGIYYYLGAYTPPTPTATPTGADASTSGADASTGTTTVHSGLAAAIEALARGQDVCPGQVTVTETKAAPACQGTNTADQRSGVTMEFKDCNAPGGTINGAVAVMGTRTASEQTCSASTVITVSFTSTITNLSIKVADGRTLMIPNQTSMGMTSFTFGQPATKADVTSNGELRIMDAAGTTQSDLTFTGDTTFTFSGSQSYSVDGITTVKDKNSNAMAMVTREGLVRSGGCCRPTAGTINVDRTGGSNPGQATWTFGPSCGEVQRNNATAQMPTCM